MAFERARRKVVSVFHQRCVYLFAALLVLLILVPFLEDSTHGRVALNIVNIAILFAAAVAVSDSRVCFSAAVILGVGYWRGWFLVDKDRIRDDTNKELPLIIGQLPVLPSKWWASRDFEKVSLEIPLGSGAVRAG